jgi:protein involved in polysaccharide export with SLBB domain
VPKLSSVTNMIPGLGDGLPADDPTVPFNANGALGYGHSIALDIYEGVRSPKRLFEGKRMVDENGVISFGKTGSAKVGGRSLIDANRMISSVFRVGGRSSFALTVHIPSVEGVDLVFIDGDVVNAAYIPMWDRMHLRDLIKIAGGRHPGSTARSLYITRAGQKMFFPNVEAAENWWRFKPGDIVTLSPDL